jgi:catechol 2,3-dioxygenase-like lactoylglutathione lyase family enzyme
MKSQIRMEGLTLTVGDVKRSIEFYKKLGFVCVLNAAPNFALMSLKDPKGSTIGLLAWREAAKDGAVKATSKQRRAIHVELSTDDLDGLYKRLIKKGVKFHAPPHDEPWERSATAFDPDGYSVEFAQGRRGKNELGKSEK